MEVRARSGPARSDPACYPRGMRVEFVKMHGTGNDFIVFDAPPNAALPDRETFRKLADRHTGIGFDQALVLEPARRPDTRVFYRIFIAALITQRSGSGPGDLVMDSPGGLVRARVHADGLVSVDMGVPNFDPRSLPFDASGEAYIYPLQAGGSEIEIGAVSIGNPHAVIRVASVDAAPVDRLGPAVENHTRFPKRTNVEFMQVVTPTHIR